MSLLKKIARARCQYLGVHSWEKEIVNPQTFRDPRGLLVATYVIGDQICRDCRSGREVLQVSRGLFMQGGPPRPMRPEQKEAILTKGIRL